MMDTRATVEAIRERLAERPGLASLRPFAFSVVEDDGGYDAPAWMVGPDWEVQISQATAEGLDAGDPHAIDAVTHQIFHALGTGPAFVSLPDQLLEEGIVEALTQHYSATPTPLYAWAAGDLEVMRPTAVNVPLERFARVAAWLAGLTQPGASVDEAVAALARDLKAVPGEQRRSEIARRAVAKVRAPEGADQDETDEAVDLLADYLGHYFNTIERSRAGFAALDYALEFSTATAYGTPFDKVTPEEGEPDPAGTWRATLAEVEATLLDPTPADGDVIAALMQADECGDPEVLAASYRSLEAIGLLSAARSLDAARLAAGE